MQTGSAIALFILILACATTCRAVDPLDVIVEDDTAFLPVLVDGIHKYSKPSRDRRIMRSAQPVGVINAANKFCTVISARNPQQGIDDAAIFNKWKYPGREVDDDKIWMTVKDFIIIKGEDSLNYTLAGSGYRNDSAYVFVLDPSTGGQSLLPLASSIDYDLGKVWKPSIFILKSIDFNQDGSQELLLYLHGESQTNHRRLYCIELQPLSVKWSLDVASKPYFDYSIWIHSDTSNLFIFSAYNLSHGITDDNFSDRYGYIVAIDQDGQIQWKRKTAMAHYSSPVAVAPDSQSIYIGHQRYIEDDEEVFLSDSIQYAISQLDLQGNIINTVNVDYRAYDLSFPTVSGEGENLLFVTGERFMTFSEDLQLVAQSHTGRDILIRGTEYIHGYDEKVQVFSDGLYRIFGNSFEQLAVFPFNIQFYYPVEVNKYGQISQMIISNTDMSEIIRLEKKNYWSIITVLYHRYQTQLLATTAILILAVLIISYFRYRASVSLKLITIQKRQLEQEQARIIAQEKYHQAREMAGGFAHEMRNALFPARGILTKMILQEQSQAIREAAKSADQAIHRAVSLTKLISRYTQIESELRVEPVLLREIVDKLLEANSVALKERSIKVSVVGDSGTRVSFNSDHLGIVITNVLINSIDALDKTENPFIKIQWEVVHDAVVVTIRDNGCGIAMDNIPRVFNPFYSTKPAKGTGIGMSFVKKLVEMYDGDISLGSSENEGTTVTLHLKHVIG